jgi:hypothetical protein
MGNVFHDIKKTKTVETKRKTFTQVRCFKIRKVVVSNTEVTTTEFDNFNDKSTSNILSSLTT